MASFSVDLEALLAGVDQMSDFHSKLEQTLASVRSSVSALGVSWHGDASSAQESAQQQWDAGAEQLREALAQLRDIAEQAHSNYSNAVATNTRMWG
ncbi:WXG100 family type VII secretion target [Mycolicibacterium sp.]|uniref:WXG100 family type VII secretion target n=1 Tax=Mycolicibacterium sp. TaxID=2320850 RepID=UPI001A2DDE6D|nr:WXG100 family type VII secretion target [Mycolicibacterium sp.]MBJ7339787.1 WXG100 family type VII secretion target [Mycolicibacterium sp.]